MYKIASNEREESLMCYIEKLEARADAAFFSGLWPFIASVPYVVMGILSILGLFYAECGFGANPPIAIMFFVIATMFLLFAVRRFNKVAPLRKERRDLLNKHFSLKEDSNE